MTSPQPPDGGQPPVSAEQWDREVQLLASGQEDGHQHSEELARQLVSMRRGPRPGGQLPVPEPPDPLSLKLRIGALEEALREAAWLASMDGGTPLAALAEQVKYNAQEALRRAARRWNDERDATSAWTEPTTEEFPGTLADSLRLPRRPQRYLIEPLWGVAHNLSIEALYKTGKTTLTGSVLASLADGTPFLGFAPAYPPAGPVAVWNCEMDREEFDDLYVAPFVRDHTRVAPGHLRHKAMPIMTSRPARKTTVAWLRWHGATTWVIDTWTRLCAWNGTDPADNAGVAKLAACLDEIKGEAGVSALAVTSHMPHAAKTDRVYERGFGAQAFSGWVDVMWRYTRNDAGERFLSADGRKTGLDEFQVLMSPDGSLYAQAGDRRSLAAEAEAAGIPVTEMMLAAHVQRNPGQTQTQILAALSGLGRNAVRKALAAAVADGSITVKAGPRNSFLHYAAGQ
jgi:hypothetical protein